MNLLFFLSPKQDLMYVYDDFTLRQTLEKWENNRYASIPVLNRQGKYVGTLTEGDILWGLKKFHGLDLEAAEDIPISADRSGHEPELCPGGGRPRHLYRHCAAAGHHPVLLRQIPGRAEAPGTETARVCGCALKQLCSYYK